MGEVCGAVSGGVLAMGLLYGQDYSVGPKTREYVHRFAEQNGAVRCIDLLGLDESSVEVILASARNRKKEVCDGLVSSAVQILLELFGGFGQLEEAAGLQSRLEYPGPQGLLSVGVSKLRRKDQQ